LEALLEKFKTEIRFILVGIWNTTFGYLMFLFFLFLFEKNLKNERLVYIFSAVCGHLISVINTFIFHKFITFKSKQGGMEIVYEFVRFSNSYIVTVLLNLGLISFQVEYLNLDPRVAGAISIPICVVVTYFLLSKYSFKNRNKI